MEDSYRNFNCFKCGLVLSVPPIFGSPLGLFCGRCPIPEDLPTRRLWCYEQLAEDWQFSCRFSSNGCQEILNFARVLQHEENCDKRPVQCPICLQPKLEHVLEIHLMDKHRANLQETQPFEVALEDQTLVKLFCNKNRVYCCQVQLQEEGLQIKVSFFGKNFDRFYTTFETRVFSGCFDRKLVFEKVTMSRFQSNDCPGEVLVPKGVVDFLLTNEKVWVQIVFAPEIQLASPLNRALKASLECPICFEVMRQTGQCPTGHSFCTKCLTKLMVCPLCQSEFPQNKITNFLVENVVKSLSICCKNHERSCHFVASSDKELQEHQNNCFVCPYNDHCNMVGRHEEITQHCLCEHSVLENLITKARCVLKPTKVTCLLTLDNYIFRYRRHCDGKLLHWRIVLIGPPSQAQNYQFTIRFKEGPSKWEFTQLCCSSQCLNQLTLPIHFLRKFQHEEDFHMSVFLTQVPKAF